MSERLRQLAYEELAPEVRPLADDILKVSSAALGGPYNALLRSPDMARRCFELLDYLRFKTSVNKRLNEFAILIQARLSNNSFGSIPTTSVHEAYPGHHLQLDAARRHPSLVAAIVVVMFAGIPFIDVDLNTIQYDSSRSAQCQVSVPQPTDTGWSQSFSTINNQSAKVPVWWAFMHALSRAVTSASVAARAARVRRR